MASIVHAHDARAHTLAALASRRRFVVSRRVSFPVRRSLASFWKYRRAARFVAVSHFVARELQAAGIPKERIDVVYDAVPAIEPLEQWQPGDPAVALASTDPQKGRDLTQKACDLAGIPVIFSDDLENDLRRASIFVYITRTEGLGSAALLAMAMGVPVVASSVGGLKELFANGVSGMLVNNNPPEIARAMRKVLEEPALAESLIANGKRRTEACFTPEHLVRGTLASYERALAA